MEIYVDKKRAVLKKGTSFDFVSENRYFSGADSYTMAITFPLKDCPENLAIFGHINRKDVIAKKLLFDCEIRSLSFYKRGSITITEITDVQVKTQFLEGKSVANYSDQFDTLYINELELGYPDTSPSNTAANAYVGHSIDDGLNYLALPWVNNHSGNLQNRSVYASMSTANKGPDSWHSSVSKLSFQPYLLYVLELICNTIGYTYDFTSLRNSPYRYLIICNTLPSAWDTANFALALPHWTLTEFFEQLEYFLNGEFDINHAERKITFGFSSVAIKAAGAVEIKNVVDEFSATIEDAGTCKYREFVNLKFADCNHRMWKYYSCKWFVDMMKNTDVVLSSGLGSYNYGKFYREVNGAQGLYIQLRDAADFVESEYSGWNPEYLYYCKYEDTYFILCNYGSYIVDSSKPENMEGNKRYKNLLEPINMFGDSIVDEDADTIELKIVPAWIDEAYADGTLQGKSLFLDCGEYHNGVDNVIPWNYSQQKLDAGEQDRSVEYFDKLYMGFWSGTLYPCMMGTLAYPVIDRIITYPNEMNYNETPFTMRLRATEYGTYTKTYKISSKKKYTFKFLADKLPNVRSVFIIHGQRYLCEKLTTNFTEDGMSQLVKAECWLVED